MLEQEEVRREQKEKSHRPHYKITRMLCGCFLRTIGQEEEPHDEFDPRWLHVLVPDELDRDQWDAGSEFDAKEKGVDEKNS